MADVEVIINTDSKDVADRVVGRNIGASIDTPNDVHFVDGAGDDTFVNYIMVEADGVVEVGFIGDGDDSEDMSVYLVKGGWHEFPGVHEVKGNDGDTEASLGIRVRI